MFTTHVNPLAWHSACNVASVAEDNAAPPERFPTEDSCFTYRYLLPFRLPQVPCSPQAQGTPRSQRGVTRLILREQRRHPVSPMVFILGCVALGAAVVFSNI